MRWSRRLAGVALSVLLGGCGAASPSGRRLFGRDCGACHTLSGIDSPSHQGGDLLGVKLSRTVLLQFMHEMPVRPPPSSSQLRAVADYILSVQSQRP
ncbi:MAG TPA: cytochrome c [Solirubrobacteraceae bacterium]|jgi:mono/diheme cytochrome c family protein